MRDKSNGNLRDIILRADDIKLKKRPVPEWDVVVYLRQLTRGEQDEYMQRQYGSVGMTLDTKSSKQDVTEIKIYGHDAYLCACSLADENSERIFSQNDVEALGEKNGELVGQLATEIIEWSEMAEDVKIAEELKN